MKTIIDYAEKIEELARKISSLDFKSFEVSEGGLQIYFEKDNEQNNYSLHVNGNGILGYDMLMTGIGFNFGGRGPETDDKKTIEEVVELNERIAKNLDFGSLTVRVGNKFSEEICKERNYEFEEKNSYQVAVKKIPTRTERINEIHLCEDKDLAERVTNKINQEEKKYSGKFYPK